MANEWHIFRRLAVKFELFARQAIAQDKTSHVKKITLVFRTEIISFPVALETLLKLFQGKNS